MAIEAHGNARPGGRMVGACWVSLRSTQPTKSGLLGVLRESWASGCWAAASASQCDGADPRRVGACTHADGASAHTVGASTHPTKRGQSGVFRGYTSLALDWPALPAIGGGGICAAGRCGWRAGHGRKAWRMVGAGWVSLRSTQPTKSGLLCASYANPGRPSRQAVSRACKAMAAFASRGGSSAAQPAFDARLPACRDGAGDAGEQGHGAQAGQPAQGAAAGAGG